MGEIVNLRIARKQKKRAEAGQTAAENRAKFGRTKASKTEERLRAEKAQHDLDDHKIETKSEDEK
jgi:hypothetical protein